MTLEALPREEIYRLPDKDKETEKEVLDIFIFKSRFQRPAVPAEQPATVIRASSLFRIRNQLHPHRNTKQRGKRKQLRPSECWSCIPSPCIGAKRLGPGIPDPAEALPVPLQEDPHRLPEDVKLIRPQRRFKYGKLA